MLNLYEIRKEKIKSRCNMCDLKNVKFLKLN